MEELVTFCNQQSNGIEVRQARILRHYLTASLLGGDVRDVRFYNEHGMCFRHASFTTDWRTLATYNV